MTTRPTRIAQTSTEVKKQHKMNGLSFPERQRRQLERAAELDRRAAQARAQEERRKALKKKREEEENREREARKHSGVGLATQLIGYSHTQAQLKSGMEAFLGLKKNRPEAKKRETEMAKNLDAVVEEVAKEPWDDDDEEDILGLPELKPQGGEQWIDDDLDDDTLLEAHDFVTSDPVEARTDLDEQQTPTAAPPAPHAETSITAKEGPAFVRLHGPINKTIENMLDKLPGPLIELLSQDTSTSLATWDPPPALLHKLTPPGLPPHRLRIKVGCAVKLLRDVNSGTNSQLSKSQRLKILRVEKGRLECSVLDGTHEGAKTLLTRVSFPAAHRNDTRFLFQRLQFPIQVAKDFAPPIIPTEPSLPSRKIPANSGKIQTSTSTFVKPSPSLPKASSKATVNPSFKLPGSPASKSKPPVPLKPALSTSLPDVWDDFLDSSTQIARDLSSDDASPSKSLPVVRHAPVSASVSSMLPPLSTQDFDDFCLDDLEDVPELNAKTAPVKPPSKTGTAQPIFSNTSKGPARVDKPRTIAPSPLIPNVQSTLKRKSLPAPPTVLPRAPKRINAQATEVNIPTKSFTSFDDIGLSTQEAASFFDDDEFGTPPIAV